jgi:hypothetical protein
MKITSPAVAQGVPFEAPDFDSDNVRDAIIEARYEAEGKARWVTLCAHDGTASSGRWLSFFANVASNITPFVVAEASTIKAISVGVQSNATATFTLFINGVAVETLQIAGQSANAKTGLNIPVASLGNLSAQVTAGSCSRPIFTISAQKD